MHPLSSRTTHLFETINPVPQTPSTRPDSPKTLNSIFTLKPKHFRPSSIQLTPEHRTTAKKTQLSLYAVLLSPIATHRSQSHPQKRLQLRRQVLSEVLTPNTLPQSPPDPHTLLIGPRNRLAPSHDPTRLALSTPRPQHSNSPSRPLRPILRRSSNHRANHGFV